MKINEARLSRQPVEEQLIGIQFERDVMTAALIDGRGRVQSKRQIATPQRTTRSVAQAMTELILLIAGSDERGLADIAGIGIAAPGLVDPQTGRITIEGMKGWTRVNLRGLIEEFLDASGHDIRRADGRRTARAQVKTSAHPNIFIDSRVNCMAAAEGWIGQARGRSNLICLSIGEDIEAGIIVNGRPLNGASGLAGAIAWLAVAETWKTDYLDRGCLGAEAAGPAITRKAIELWSTNPNTLLGKLIKADVTQVDFETIIRSARADDALADTVIKDLIDWLGRSMASLIAVLNPEAIILSGPLGLAIKPYLNEIRDETAKWAHPQSGADCKIVVSSLGEKAVLPGAARMAHLHL